MPLAEAYATPPKVMTENMMARDAEEGICAFIEKRDPDAGKTDSQALCAIAPMPHVRQPAAR